MKIVTVVGARPQFIKAAAVSRILRARPGVQEILVHTGQHFDDNMSAIFFKELAIPLADYNLGVSGGGHGAQTGRMLEAVEEVLVREQPNWVLVYGDTNSTLAGALAAAKLHIPVAHVEAGLRSFNRHMPEEVNRVLTDHTSDLLFAPTELAARNLAREGIPEDRVRRVGDVMYDVALFYGEKAERESDVLLRLGLARGEYVLATIHRAENTDQPARLQAIFEGLNRVADEFNVVVPLHPRTRTALQHQNFLEAISPTTQIIEPVGYLDMLSLTQSARLVVTDSGGLQKEAFFMRVPCVTLREETEWIELLEAGWNHLLPPAGADAVYLGVLDHLSRPLPPPGSVEFPYGEGDAAYRIVQHLTFQHAGKECSDESRIDIPDSAAFRALVS